MNDKKIFLLNSMKKIETLSDNINKLLDEFNIELKDSSEYIMLPNLEYMKILFKGDIFEHELVKNINREFNLDELEDIINKKEQDGENLDDLVRNIKLYKKLDIIIQKQQELNNLYIKTINKVLNKNYNKENIDKNEIKKLINIMLKDGQLDNFTGNYLTNCLNKI